MEILRIQEVHGQRVERAGSEQERRKRQQEQPAEFADDLRQEFEHDADGAQHEPAVTPDALPGIDTVTLSPAGRVSSEVLQARGGLRFSLPGNLTGNLRALRRCGAPQPPAPEAASGAALPAPATLDRVL